MNDYNNFFDFRSPPLVSSVPTSSTSSLPKCQPWMLDDERVVERGRERRTTSRELDDINNMWRYLHSIFFWLETAFSRALLSNELSSMSCQLSFACKAHRLTYAFLLLRFSYLKDAIRTEFVKSDLTFGELVTFTRSTLSRGYLTFFYVHINRYYYRNKVSFLYKTFQKRDVTSPSSACPLLGSWKFYLRRPFVMPIKLIQLSRVALNEENFIALTIDQWMT